MKGIVGAAILTLTAFVLCMLPQPAPSGTATGAHPAATPDIVWHTAGEVTVPFEYFKRHIYVTLSIDGKPGYVFMLDSGANRNILNLRTARQLGMEPGAVKQEKNIGFGDAPVYVAPQENLIAEIQSVPVAQAMAVMDLTRLEQHFSHTINGMLGYPFFQRFVVKVDFQRRLLSLFPPERYRYRGWGIQVALKSSRNFVVMPIALRSAWRVHHRIDVAVDTGSDVTLMLYEHFVNELGLQDSLNRALPAKAFGLNGYYPVALGSVDWFRIGDVEAHNVPVDYLADSEEVGSVHNVPGAVGMGVLRSFRVVIFDVPHQRMVFELRPPLVSPGTARTITGDPK